MSRKPRPYINRDLRRLVASRAGYLCEYCLIKESDTIFGCAINSAISLKHSGSSEVSNLVYACGFCNRYKGSNIGGNRRIYTLFQP